MRRINRRYAGVMLAGAFCMLALASVVYTALQSPAVAQQPATPTFDFERYTRKKAFTLNTLQTTPYGPPWADIIVQQSNFLECKGAAIALCYYSGPGPTTPCTQDGLGIANCTCYEIPAGQPYLVDINAILNRDIYLKTVAKCGKQGERCRPTGPLEAPVCDAINNNTLIPGADLVSTFSLYLEKQAVADKDKEFFILPTLCPSAAYAGCMTAPCKRTGKRDPNTNLPLVQCGCPTFTGPYQVGKKIPQEQCVLEGNYVWSAAYNVPSPTPTPSGK
jgi:hypothetical protein